MVANGYKRFTKVDLAEVLSRKPQIRLKNCLVIEEDHGEDNR